MTLKNFKNPYKIGGALISITLLYFSCYLMIKSAATPHEVRTALALSTLFILLSASKKTFWIIAFPICILYAAYAPLGLIFGKPNYQHIASILSTNLLETKEFFYQIPIINFIYPFIIIAGILVYRIVTIKAGINFYKNKTLITILILLSMIHQSPFQFFNALIKETTKVENEIIKVNNIKDSSDWGEAHLLNSKYDNYILIIGESARKDYHNAYGYPIKNTPFMSSSNGLVVNGLKSGGTNTVSSLRLMLTHPDTNNWEPNYNLNIVNLIKASGIKTYWISNQGVSGKFDTPVTYIANSSDEKYFLKYGDYYTKNTSDFELLKEVEHIIKNNDNQKKLIVIHLMGSHLDSCERIADYKKIITTTDRKYDNLNCYISSINKTDDFIKEINNYLLDNYKENNKSYSMIYFSDHGQTHFIKNKQITLNHTEGKFSYDVPLFKVSSDDTERKKCNSFKSGLNFTNGIASWIGIKNSKLDANYSLFDCKNDPDDYGLKRRIDSIKAEPDPAIDLTGK